MDEPTATPTARSILFLYATVTAVTCYDQMRWSGGTHLSSVADYGQDNQPDESGRNTRRSDHRIDRTDKKFSANGDHRR